MPISVDTLRGAAIRLRAPRVRTLTEARNQGLQTVFLCHSHRDQALVNGVVTLLEEAGWRVYVDWADTSMPDTPTRETAARIKQKIADLVYFMFLATTNSMSSRWCPWEIGYADGVKDIDRILILPTTDGGKAQGSEYLELYRRIDLSTLQELAVWQPGQTTGGVPVRNL
jgi:hypothetical protein